MASIRKLPSGNWQASVLLDGGKRTTSTHPTRTEALDWAGRTEAERDERRAAKAARRVQRSNIDITVDQAEALVCAAIESAGLIEHLWTLQPGSEPLGRPASVVLGEAVRRLDAAEVLLDVLPDPDRNGIKKLRDRITAAMGNAPDVSTLID
jgi:hypothetical protein